MSGGPILKKPNEHKSHLDISKSLMKLAQLEVADKEACRYLKSLCEEASVSLGNEDTNIHIQDMKSGILLLANYHKKIKSAKENVEESLKQFKEDFKKHEAGNKLKDSRYEAVISKLQNENQQMKLELDEIKVKNDTKIRSLTREIDRLHTSLIESKNENDHLQYQIEALNTKVLEIPRMEEQYLRTARGIARLKDAGYTQRDIAFKKLEEEVKQITFWKNKAKSLEETVLKHEATIDNLSNQSRINLYKYQNLLQETQKLEKKGLESSTDGILLPSPKIFKHLQKSTSHENLNQKGGLTSSSPKRKGRPKSAPSGQDGINHRQINNNSNSPSRDNRDQLDDRMMMMSDYQTNSLSRTSSNLIHNVDHLQHKTISEIQLLELYRLRELNEKKDEYITKLSTKLSLARTFPLISVQPPSYVVSEFDGIIEGYSGVENHHHMMGKSNQKSTNNSSKINFVDNFFAEIDATKVEEDELELMQNAEYQNEEEVLEQARIQRAREIQIEFNNRILGNKVKSKASAHVQAIRQSKQFN